MKGKSIGFISGLLLSVTTIQAQSVLLSKDKVVANQVSVSWERMMGKEAIKVVKDPTIKAADEPTFVRLKGVTFTNGTIEVKVLSRLLKNAAPTDRGFIGVAFRVDDTNSNYESIYIRPTNGRADDQVRRNHSIQYYAYPHFKFDRLREEEPGRYESYADMTLNEWITLTIVVEGKQAKLYLNHASQPALVVKEMKHEVRAGGIGLWVDVGTEGYFSEVKITAQ